MGTQLNVRPRFGKGHTLVAVLATAALSGLVMIWLQIDWAWSPVDDAGHVLALNALIEESGPVIGTARYAIEMFAIDLSWGLFRPSYWLYPSFFYLLPTGPAHVVRLLMALLAIIGPVVHFYRQGIRGAKLVFIALLLVTAGTALYIGLFLVSLQELSGMAFVGLGLLLSNRWLRWISWTIAAWFKAPFAWLLIGQAIADWRRGDRKLALANGGVGVGTLAVAVVMSRTGSYTSTYTIDPYMIWFNAKNLLEPINVVVLIIVLWWLIVLQGRITWTSDTTVFAVGWVGYTAQLLPWSVTAYYMGPISFLFGLTLASMLRLPGTTVTPIKAMIGWSVPAVLGTIVVTDALLLGFRINNAMFTFQSCIQGEPSASAFLSGDVVYVTSSEEAPTRLKQNLTIADPTWNGTVNLLDRDLLEFTPTPGDYLLIAGSSPIDTSDLTLVCSRGNALVYEYQG